MGDNGNMSSQQEQLKGIAKPHEHDVLSGRGNFVNHHSGNENFRKLVKQHKKAYVACPKAQKAIYSKIIYDEIRAMNPPGRFLKQDPKTKLWGDIGEKKALDKTRQALREGAPELLKELETEISPTGEAISSNDGQDFVTPLLTQRNNPLAASLMGNASLGSFTLGSLSGMNSFTTGSANFNSFSTRAMQDSNSSFSLSSFTMPQQAVSNINNLRDSQGAHSILAAAAQLQAQQQAQHHQQQQQQQQQQQMQHPNYDAQMEMLKQQLQMNSQQAYGQADTQQHAMAGREASGVMGSNQNSGINGMPPSPAQAGSGNLPMGSTDISALLSAIHQSATGMNNNISNGGMGDAYQQQIAQLARFSHSMNDSDCTVISGNTNHINNPMDQINERTDSTTSANSFGSMVAGNNDGQASFGMIAQQQQHQQQQQQQHQQQQQQQGGGEQQQQQQQKFYGGIQEQSFNVSLPLKSPSESHFDGPMEPVRESNRPSNRLVNRGLGGGLNSSFTRAQRIGLKNSFTRRPARQLTNAEMHGSLMSIESLTLDDISDDFCGNVTAGVFEDSEKNVGSVKHGNGPNDMSEVSVEFEGKA